MKIDTILAYIRGVRDRHVVWKIVNAAAKRDGDLATRGRRVRARLWEKFKAMGLKKGDMVFLHKEPPKTSTHHSLWAKPLTVWQVRERYKEIVVRRPSNKMDHRLGVYNCDRFKLSKTPSPEAFAAGLADEGVAGDSRK